MVTITLMGQLQTADGERDFACDLAGPMTVRQLIHRQGQALRPVLQLMREKKVLVTVNKRIASEDTHVQDGDSIKLVAHDGMGGTGLAPTL
ncbi:MAG: MoaD/ThiS family protein [Nitrospiraceae bacterium]